jgi:hypothetical protein
MSDYYSSYHYAVIPIFILFACMLHLLIFIKKINWAFKILKLGLLTASNLQFKFFCGTF